MRRIAWVVIAAALGMAALGGCKSGGSSTSSSSGGSNWLIGTWNLQQPNPPQPGQSTEDCLFTKWIFTDNTQQSFIGDKTGGPDLIHYVAQGDTMFASALQNIAFTKVDANTMYWSAAYGRCYYVRG